MGWEYSGGGGEGIGGYSRFGTFFNSLSIFRTILLIFQVCQLIFQISLTLLLSDLPLLSCLGWMRRSGRVDIGHQPQPLRLKGRNLGVKFLKKFCWLALSLILAPAL